LKGGVAEEKKPQDRITLSTVVLEKKYMEYTGWWEIWEGQGYGSSSLLCFPGGPRF